MSIEIIPDYEFLLSKISLKRFSNSFTQNDSMMKEEREKKT